MFALPPIQPDPPAARPAQAAPVAPPGAAQAVSGETAGEGHGAGRSGSGGPRTGTASGGPAAGPPGPASGPAAELAPSLRALLSALRSGAAAAAGPAASGAGAAPAPLALPAGAGPLAAALASAAQAATAGPPGSASAPAAALPGAAAAGSPRAAPQAPAAATVPPADSAPSAAPAFGAGSRAIDPAALSPDLARAALVPFASALFLRSAPRARGAALVLSEWWAQTQSAPAGGGASPWRALLAALAQPPELAEPAFGAWRRLLLRLAQGQEDPEGEPAAGDAAPPELAEALAAERLSQSARSAGGQTWALAWPWFDGQTLRELWVHAEPEPEPGATSGVQRASVGLELPRLGALRADFWLHGAGLSVRLCFERDQALAAARAACDDLASRLGCAGRTVRLELALDAEAARSAARGQLGGGSEFGPGWRA